MDKDRDKARIYDITLPIGSGLPVWPGDPEVVVSPEATIAADGFNTSVMSLGSHTGTHVDAPWHFLENGTRLDDIPIGRWSGLCHVARIPDHRDIVTATDLEAAQIPLGTTHLLLKTRNSSLWNKPRPWQFDPAFVGIAASAAQWIVDSGAGLVGIDYFSIGPFNEPEHETHLILLTHDVLILEGLDLRRVPPGPYTLTCLPLRVLSGDGAPARAILTSLP
jgi:arylformamidase